VLFLSGMALRIFVLMTTQFTRIRMMFSKTGDRYLSGYIVSIRKQALIVGIWWFNLKTKESIPRNFRANRKKRKKVDCHDR